MFVCVRVCMMRVCVRVCVRACVFVTPGWFHQPRCRSGWKPGREPRNMEHSTSNAESVHFSLSDDEKWSQGEENLNLYFQNDRIITHLQH